MTDRPAARLPAVSVVVPAFNEERRIGATLARIEEYCAGALEDYEIIVVDDGSRDRTGEVCLESVKDHARLRVVRNDPNRGKGYSVRVGALAARMPFILLSDADLSTPIEEVEHLLPLASTRNIVIASRGLRNSTLEVRQPFYREMMGKVFNRIVQILLLPGISDTQCGFKLFGRDVVREVFPRMTIERFAFDVEILALALRKGFEVREVPVRWRNDDRTRVDAVRDSASMFRDVIGVWWKLRGVRD